MKNKAKEEILKEWLENRNNPNFDSYLFIIEILVDIRDLLKK